MRPRTLAALFALVAGLLAFIWFYERELPSTEERVELAKRVLRLEPEEVRGLVLTRGDEPVRLERLEPGAGEADDDAAQVADAGGWRLREPFDAAADSAAVDRLVETVAGLEKNRTLAEGEAEPAALGLAEPRGRLTLETADGPVELLIGSEVPASSTMILGVAGRAEAYVVDDALWRDLDKPGGDWRSKDLGPASREAVQRIALGSGEAAVALGRRGESFWVEAPYVDRADRELVAALLGQLVGLRAERFIDQPPADEPAGAPIEVVLAGREAALRIELAGPVGDDEELRLARVDGQRVEIRSELATALDRAPEAWRSRSWTSFEVYQIDRLVARDGEGETAFARDGGDWLRDGGPVEYSPVSDLLYALTGVEAESTVPGAAPAAEPVLTLELSGDDGERRETLTLYPAGEGGFSPARVDGREVTLRLAEGAVSDLQLKLSEARSAEAPAAETPDELDSPSED